MRLGVLDIGSNTGHLLVVDAHYGAAPTPAYSHKEPLRLAENMDDSGEINEKGIEALTRFVRSAMVVADDKGCAESVGFATSAVRDATNCDAVLQHVADLTGVKLDVMSGVDEARLTYLAARRWFGWSSGRLAVFDIGGGSLEIAAGADELPDVAWSLRLGAARLTRDHLSGHFTQSEVAALRKHVRVTIARDAGNLRRSGSPDRAVATSKTFRSLARVCGAAPASAGPFVRRVLTRADVSALIPELARMDRDEIARLPGVSQNRAHQILSGALVAEGVMEIFDLPELEICPWALREGVLLERLDHYS